MIRCTCAFGQRRGRHRHGEEGLAGAGRPDAEGDRLVADRVDVALLVERLRRHLGVAVPPDDVLEDLRRALARRRARRSRLRSSPAPPRGPARSARPARRPPSPPSARRPRSPSSVSTLPRRWKSQSRWPRSSRSTASSEPASSAATALSRVSCLRAKPLTHRRADPLAVGAPADLGHQRRHHLAHLLLLAGTGLGDRGVDQLGQLLVGELLRAGRPRSAPPRSARRRPAPRARPRRRRRPPRARFLRSRCSTATSSPSPSLASFCSESTIIRRAPARSRSPAFIAVRTSACTCSRTLIGHKGSRPRPPTVRERRAWTRRPRARSS